MFKSGDMVVFKDNDDNKERDLQHLDLPGRVFQVEKYHSGNCLLLINFPSPWVFWDDSRFEPYSGGPW